MIGNTRKVDQTLTVQEFIALRNTDEITYYNFSILEYNKGFDMFITNLLYDYEDDILSQSIVLQLNDVERAKYRYNPGLLAYDIYGSTEMKFIIMMLNNIIDPKEFDFNKIRVVRTNDLNLLLSRIQSVNETYLNNNRSKLKSDFKENDGNNVW